MADRGFVLHEEEFRLVEAELKKLHQQTNAKVTILVDKNGQLIASTGETEGLDTTSLASLTAGNIAATGGMAKLLGESEFSILFHEGERDNIHICLIGDRVILVVIFDQRSSLGLVRLRVKKSTETFAQIFDRVAQRSQERDKPRAAVPDAKAAAAPSPIAEITEEDIEKLFG
jgi:predicted regulator of Ras-like GTPase activity (Roadblock/LC7/MglB family)